MFLACFVQKLLKENLLEVGSSPPLPPLGKGTVKEEWITSKSYAVERPDGRSFRRNHRHMFLTKGQVPSADVTVSPPVIPKHPGNPDRKCKTHWLQYFSKS